jgi:serine/threonine-protein kinase
VPESTHGAGAGGAARPRRDPERFADYLLYGKIAAGGMASVFLAQTAEDAGDWLAVKRVHPHLSSRDDVRQMFLNEAKLLSQLDHPNICGILDYGIHQDTPFLVMRYLHGAPLSGMIRRTLDLGRRLPIDLMAYVIACVCEGLHYAHEAKGSAGPLGLVHRDISPQNIFITFAGDVKLLDFGVAKAAGYQGLTRTGHIKGKYAYMSPEQVGAQPLDRRSDIFSLGIVLWESITGRHLFKRKREIDTLRAIARAKVPAAAELNAAVPKSLDQIVARALHAEQDRRYQTAQEMGTALWSYLTTTQVPMGSDEVAEIMSATYPDAPRPGELGPNATELEVPAATQSDRPSVEDLSTGESVVITADEDEFDEQTRRADGDGDLDDFDGPTGTDGEWDSDRTKRVEDLAAMIPSLDQPTLPQPMVGNIDALGQPTLQDMPMVEIAPELLPWRMKSKVEVATQRAEELAERTDAGGDTTDEQGVVEKPAAALTERPRLEPHPFDPDHGGTIDPDVPDTVVTDERAQAHQVITTIPREAISENPDDQVAASPTIQLPERARGTVPQRPVENQRDLPTLDPGEDKRSPWPILILGLVMLAIGIATITFFATQVP